MAVTNTVRHETRTGPTMADRLASIALVAAGVAAATGLVRPSLYRDTAEMVREARAADFVTLVGAVPVLALGLARTRRGSPTAPMVTLGAIGYLAYSYAIYGFSVVINPLTPLHLAILGLTAWSFLLGLRTFGPDASPAIVEASPPRRTTAGFLLVVAALFGTLWLGQIVGAITTGRLPASISDLELPTNAVYALDLSFALPLLAVVGIWLIRGDRRANAAAVAALTFTALMGSSVLAIFVVDARAGAPLEAVPLAVFVAVTAVAATLLFRSRIGTNADLTPTAAADRSPRAD